MTTNGHSSDDDPRAPRLSDPTDIEPVRAFNSTGRSSREGIGQYTQLTSDPPTALVPRNSFRELPPGSVVDDTYEIDARLGAGAMGEVYAARHMKLGKRVAIKVIGQRLSEDDAAIERFAMEARTLAQIQHPAIVAVEHVGELADGRAYFVMEFLRGESLFERLQRGRIPLPEALRILDQMARGLDAAHEKGIVHRDLKPENTFLAHLPGEPPTVKLVDFGLAKLRNTDDLRAERTQSGVAIGTPMYMSPEQARGPDVDHRTDIYALGCVAYELVLGVPLFPHARTAPELYAAHLAEAAPPPRSIWREIPLQLDLCLVAMVAKNPDHRPTLEQVRAVIANAQASAAARHAPTEFVGPRLRRPRQRMLAIAIALTLVGGVTIGLVGFRPRGSADVPANPRPDPVRTRAPQNEQSVVPQIDAAQADAPGAEPLVVDDPPPKPPRRRDNSRPSTARQTPRATSPPIAADNAPAVTPPTQPPLTDKPVDRNQIINPFAKKRPKVNP